MRYKFLGTGEPRCHLLRTLRPIGPGLHYAAIYDFSVAWKPVFSLCILIAALSARAWMDSLLTVVVAALTLLVLSGRHWQLMRGGKPT